MKSVSTELRELRRLYDYGELSRQEFERAKRVVLGESESAPSVADLAPVEEDLARLELQNELLRIDHEWQMVQDRYKTAAYEGGARENPSGGGMALVVGASVLFAAFGIFVVTCTSDMWSGSGMGGMVAVFGVFALLVAIGGPLLYVRKYSDFHRARKDHETRRRATIEQFTRHRSAARERASGTSHRGRHERSVSARPPSSTISLASALRCLTLTA